MAAQDKVTFKQDLTEPVKIRHYEGVVFTGDDCGNLIKVALFDGGAPYSDGGTVSATAVLADGTTFPLTQGSITGNMVSVPLEAGALVVSGPMGLYVKISGNGIICTVLNAIFTVQVTDTGRVPAATVTTVNELVQEIKDAQDSFPADLTNLLAAVAPTFSTSTAYSAGAYVWQGGKLYRFTAAHPAGTWTGTDAVTVALGDDVADLKSALTDSQILLPGTWIDGKYVAGANVEIENQYYSIGEFNLSNVRGKVYISTYGASTVGWVLLDSNNAVIERSLFTNSTGIDYNFTRLVDTKTNGAKLRVSCATAQKDKQVVCFVVMDNNFTPITADITTVFDNVRRNSVYNVEVSNTTATANKVPYDNFHGSIITTGGIDASQQQLALSYDRRLFYRRKFNSWSAWAEIAIGTPIAASASTDFNAQTNPFFYCGVGGLTVATNHVPYDGFNGCVYNIDYGGNFASQIAIANNGAMYYRYKYVTWSGWFSVPSEERVERLENDYCILSEFANIFCAGDSLTWGAVYTGSGSSDFRAAKKPYNAVLQLRTGVPVARNAQPGIDAKAYVNKLSSITEKENQLVIIYLGTNGGLTNTLDTDAPGTDKSQYNLTTETGSYAYIVKHCLDVNAKVLLVKIYAGGGSNGVTTTNSVISMVAEKFGVAVIENESLPQKYHIWPNGQGYDYTHLNDFGYAAFAEYLIRQVNAMDATMLARILPSN